MLGGRESRVEPQRSQVFRRVGRGSEKSVGECRGSLIIPDCYSRRSGVGPEPPDALILEHIVGDLNQISNIENAIAYAKKMRCTVLLQQLGYASSYRY